MKKPQEKDPKDIPEAGELTDEEIEKVAGGVLTPDPIFKTVTPIAGCNCNKGRGSTADWTAAG